MTHPVNPLDELAVRFGTDKATSGHGYAIPYYELLGPLRDRELTLLEIGVAGGASLRMWEAFLLRGPGLRHREARRSHRDVARARKDLRR